MSIRATTFGQGYLILRVGRPLDYRQIFTSFHTRRAHKMQIDVEVRPLGSIMTPNQGSKRTKAKGAEKCDHVSSGIKCLLLGYICKL